MKGGDDKPVEKARGRKDDGEDENTRPGQRHESPEAGKRFSAPGASDKQLSRAASSGAVQSGKGARKEESAEQRAARKAKEAARDREATGAGEREAGRPPRPDKASAAADADLRSAASAALGGEAKGRNAPPAAPEPVLIGGYRRGDCVQSLISRMRHGLQVLELGHEGIIVGACPSSSSSSAAASADKASDKSPADNRLLVQFNLGFDWLLCPHQVCHKAQFPSLTSAGLPGGLRWGDKVQCLEAKLHPRGTMRGLSLGDPGVVTGPGAIHGKVAVRFDGDGGEWSMWPSVICKAEAYQAQLAVSLPGSLRRGDRVRSKALRVSSGMVRDLGDGAPSSIEDGKEGTVIGPGHTSGKLLVVFDECFGVSWSVDAGMVVPI
jgi:hypothetical protein